MSRAQHITQVLKGRWFGSYGVARCVIHADQNPSLRLRDGDIHDRLLVRCYAGCDAKQILDELRRRGLLDDDAAFNIASSQDDLRRQSDRAHQHRLEAARSIWHHAKPATGTVAEAYLRNRGITLPIPQSIRCCTELKHGPTGLLLPAMVAAIQSQHRDVIGVHRIYLTADGSGKAVVSDNKLSLGPISGGAVRLARAGEELAIAEGIETALSYMQATGTPTWAALSTSGMRSVVLPSLPQAATVYLAVDLDPHHAGEDAASAAAERFDREGRKVKIARPADGSKDFNDSLRACSAA